MKPQEMRILSLISKFEVVFEVEVRFFKIFEVFLEAKGSLRNLRF